MQKSLIFPTNYRGLFSMTLCYLGILGKDPLNFERLNMLLAGEHFNIYAYIDLYCSAKRKNLH